MHKRNITAGLLFIIVALALVGTGTYAYFSDTASSTGNSFTSGSMGMKQADDDEGPVDATISETWVMENMQPCVTVAGDVSSCDSNSRTLNTISYYNHGSILGDHMEFSFSFSGDVAMAEYIRILHLQYDGYIPLSAGSLSDTNGNGYPDLEDLASPLNSSKLDNLPKVNALGHRDLTMDLGFSSTAGNTMQGKSMTMVVTATLNQDASQ
ncbi:MAG: TasA family protein [Thermoleophilia bacterium]